MTGRVVLIVTLVVVAALAGWFAVARWDDANKVAAVVACLAGVASVGVAIWLGLRTATKSTIVVARTGDAKATDGRAVSGFSGTHPGDATVTDTGDAEATGGGDAVSGFKAD